MRSIQQLFDLSGKTAVVTGGTRSLGQAMAIGLAEAGADIILIQVSTACVSRQTSSCMHSRGLTRKQRNNNNDETKKIIEGLGRKVYTFICDMNDRKALTDIIPEITASHRVDILVNAAGIVRRSPSTEHSIEDYDETMQTNVTASWLLCQGVGRYWLKEGLKGKIINVSSVLGAIGAANHAPYAMSKGAIELMTKSLSNEWASKGINVNIIAPG